VAGIQRLAIHSASSATTVGSGTSIWTADGDYLVSVIATNTNATDAEISVTLKTSAGTEAGGALIAYKLPLPAYNSYETFRFGVNNTDAIFIAGSAGVRYFVQGIEQIG
jgi:hypothetical protein